MWSASQIFLKAAIRINLAAEIYSEQSVASVKAKLRITYAERGF